MLRDGLSIGVTYMLIILFFFIDVCVYGFFSYPWIHIVLCWYTIAILKEFSPLCKAGMLFCILLEDLLATNIYGISLLYVMPVGIAVHIIRNNFHPHTPLFSYSMTCGMLMLRAVVLAWVNGYSFFITVCTGREICINLIVTYIILKFLSEGK
jgi:hypothetical protein